MATVVRLVAYLAGRERQVYQLLYVDDGLLLAGGRETQFATKILYALWILVLAGVPVSWKKVRGGIGLQWIGYVVDLGGASVGISQSKVDWLVGWVRGSLVPGVPMPVALFRQALGRFSFVAGVLRYSRPLLGPLFAWVGAMRYQSMAVPPPAVILAARWFAEK
eukprot:4542614-Amphidinium_carterae.1